MAQNKTHETQQSVEAFLNALPDQETKKDGFEILEMMRSATGAEPKLWSSGLIGFGKYKYKYSTGQTGDWFLIGFAPRKQKFSIYLMGGLQAGQELLQKLGKYKTGKGCLYFNKLTDIDKAVFKKLLAQSVKVNEEFSAKIAASAKA